MSVFAEVKLNWEGREYVIPPDRVLGAIASVEEFITLNELAQKMRKNAPPLATLAKAYAALLRYAGAKIDDDAVYAGMFVAGGGEVVTAVAALLGLMIPPSLLGAGGAEANPTRKRRRAK